MNQPKTSLPVESTPSSSGVLWTGRILSLLPVVLLTMSTIMKLTKNAEVVKGFGEFGLGEHLILPIGVVELICTVLYVVPRTAAIGAILLTGYLGGAVLTHLRVGQPWFMPIVVGVMLWTGLVLRQPKRRSILPW